MMDRMRRLVTKCMVAGQFCLATMIAPVAASEAAHVNIIGFSEDGRYFVFEEFGLMAGSGSPFTNLYVIDLPANRWVPGTPLRHMIREGAITEGDEYRILDDIRSMVIAEASTLLDKIDVTIPASVVFARGVGDLAKIPNHVTIRIPYSDRLLAEKPFTQFHLLLEVIPAEDMFDTTVFEHCIAPPNGYRLTLLEPGVNARVLHEDQRVPRSRGCVHDYRLSHFLVPDWPSCRPEVCSDGPLGVALISVFIEGFEGLSRRFIAAPVPIREFSRFLAMD